MGARRRVVRAMPVCRERCLGYAALRGAARQAQRHSGRRRRRHSGRRSQPGVALSPAFIPAGRSARRRRRRPWQTTAPCSAAGRCGGAARVWRGGGRAAAGAGAGRARGAAAHAAPLRCGRAAVPQVCGTADHTGGEGSCRASCRGVPDSRPRPARARPPALACADLAARTRSGHKLILALHPEAMWHPPASTSASAAPCSRARGTRARCARRSAAPAAAAAAAAGQRAATPPALATARQGSESPGRRRRAVAEPARCLRRRHCRPWRRPARRHAAAAPPAAALAVPAAPLPVLAAPAALLLAAER